MVSSISGSAGLNAIQQLMAEMQKKMKAADTDGKAGLSKEEISAIGTEGDNGGANFLNALVENFDKFDKNGDGQLSKDDIKSLKPPVHRPMGPPPGMMMEDFVSSDTDGTTGLSKNEISAIDAGGNKGKADMINNLTQNFDALDTNKDGQVTFEEMMSGIKSNSSIGQAQGSGEGSSLGLLKNTGAGDVSSYISKLLSNYQKNPLDLTSILDLAV